MPKFYSDRSFIGGKDVDSYVHISGGYEGYQIKIADCDRAAKMWFSFGDKKKMKKSLKKLDNLLRPLLKLQKKLQDIYDATP